MTTRTVWHFAGATLRDGSPHPALGDVLAHIEDPVPCERGYHGSPDILDALSYVAGPWLCRRELSGTILPHGDPVDKYCASDMRQVSPYVDVSDVLRCFARFCAWQARQFASKAFDEIGLTDHATKLRAFAEDCDLAAAEAAARDAARAARVTGDTARAAAWAARDAAGAAGAAWAARDAARAARVTGDTARAAAWVAEAAAWAVRAAAWAAGDTARAARAAQSKWLLREVGEE